MNHIFTHRIKDEPVRDKTLCTRCNRKRVFGSLCDLCHADRIRNYRHRRADGDMRDLRKKENRL